MKASEIKCVKCSKNMFEIQGWLERTNPKGEEPIVECRPTCGAVLDNNSAVLGAISGEQHAAKS